MAGTFNANPKEVVAPFGSQQKQQRASHQQYQAHQNQAHPRQDDDHKRGWRREAASDVDGQGPHIERGSSRGRGRGGQTRNRREEDREG